VIWNSIAAFGGSVRAVEGAAVGDVGFLAAVPVAEGRSLRNCQLKTAVAEPEVEDFRLS